MDSKIMEGNTNSEEQVLKVLADASAPGADADYIMKNIDIPRRTMYDILKRLERDGSIEWSSIRPHGKKRRCRVWNLTPKGFGSVVGGGHIVRLVQKARQLRELGRLLWREQNYLDAEKYIDEALSISVGRNSKLTGHLHIDKAIFNAELERHDEAGLCFRKAVVAFGDALPARYFNCMAYHMALLGRYEDAVIFYRDALNNNPDTDDKAMSYLGLGATLAYLNDNDGGEENNKKAREWGSKSSSDIKSLVNISLLRNEGILARNDNIFSDALEKLTKARDGFIDAGLWHSAAVVEREIRMTEDIQNQASSASKS